MAFKPRSSVVASGARTVTGNSGAIGIAELGNTISIALEVTAQSGTSPTLLVTVDWSFDGTTFFVLDPGVDTFTSISATTPKVVKTFPVRAPFYRVNWTIGGTGPSFTFAVHEYVTS